MIEYMFNIPIFKFEIKEWKSKKQKLLNLYQEVFGEIENDDNLLTNYHKQSYIVRDKIHHIFYPEIKLFLQEINCKQCVISYAWFEKSLKYSYHGIHNHGAVGYSSVCFVDYDSEEHTPTKFLSPFNNFLTGSNLIYVPENIKEGSIIFFPSVISHYTEANLSDKERLIISFNLNIE